ncbi:MAG: hypothetical protein JO345_36455 [Streptosporangiaceae bacterium]|nr:hypothetical protein [Streptosporangiaceae bacterium]
MSTRHSWKISRNAAKRLLDGHTGPDSDPLTRVLTAAAAPARDRELAGEQMVVAAFEANHLGPVVTPQKEHKSMLAKLLTVKVLFTSLAACATGGVALAASTGALTGSTSPHAMASPSQPAASWTQPAPSGSPSSAAPSASASNPLRVPGGSTGTQATSTASASASASPTAQSLPQGATALCKALIGDVATSTGVTSSQSGELQALSSSRLPGLLKRPEFSSLISITRSATTVPDYCALLLDLPQLPQPSDLAQLPSTVLGQLLTALPASTLSQVLTSLPSSTLSQVMTALPASALSQVLTSLPTATVTQLLNELPTSTLTQLPSSVLSQLPQSVLSQLPTSALSQLGL